MGFFNPAPKSVTLDQAKAAAALFGMPLEGLTDTAVQSAFRQLIRTVHPDSGGDPESAAQRIKDLTSARNMLLVWIEDLPDDNCPKCKGAGFVRSSAFGAAKPCPMCSPS